MLGRIFGPWLVMAALSACGAPERDVYALGADEAYERLAHSELPDLRFVRQCGILIHIQPEGVPGRSVTWRVYSSGQQMVNFTATLVPLGEHRTRAEVSVSTDANGREAYDGSQSYPRPALRQPLRPAVEEQVAALLEGRDYDPSRVPRGDDPVCNVQRAGLEGGRRFSIPDEPGYDTRTSEQMRRARARDGWGG